MSFCNSALDVLAQLKERGISLHMVDLGGDVTGNGISKLVFTILSAEAERDRIRERVRDVKRDQKECNRFLGGTVSFGMELAEDGSLIPDPIAQAAIATMREGRAAGRSLRQCAEMVRDRHWLEVSHMTVKRVLEAERTAASMVRCSRSVRHSSRLSTWYAKVARSVTEAMARRRRSNWRAA